MNTRHLLIALVLAAASSAVTAETYAQTPAAHGKTRAQVVDELKQARADGSMTVADSEYPKLPPFVSSKSRSQVLDELKQARADGSLSISDGEYPKLPAFVSTKSRAQVLAELAEYQKRPDPQGLYQGY
ncbi:DUF4148 domain-containing protein [Herbaspirillum sp. WKF16]|uniref:DUF4148 domain-containing protein n=1 Tax=Herbaspirillum sp. WKF16 TaxID=3028312 RepID=UPI0023A9F6BA|nr:DUF4148 domain-containing protein [Herbaspirillum sp. WKF16]WDZ97019.1 DUF4148 domain-containing protein [Herbaspirillum sp. WKF16]